MCLSTCSNNWLVFLSHHLNLTSINSGNYYFLFLSDKTKSSSPGIEEGISPRGFFATDVWRKYRVESNGVNQWTANLRMVWLKKIK